MPGPLSSTLSLTLDWSAATVTFTADPAGECRIALSISTDSTRAAHSGGALTTGLTCPVTEKLRVVPRSAQMGRNRSYGSCREHPKIDFLVDTIIESIDGDEKVRRLSLRNLDTERRSELEVGGIFIFIGFIPNTQAGGRTS